MMSTTATIKEGQAAPDFGLKDQDQKEVKLSDFKGSKNVVLAFYPFDWSPVCQNENKCFTDDFSKFSESGAEILGISCDSTWSHKAWADAMDFKQRLLSDLKREVVKKYGLYLEDFNCAQRATVIVDKTGTVRYVKVQPVLEARNDQEILNVLKTLK
jgi:peroxiredoxin